MPTSLPIRLEEKASATSSSAMIAVILVFAILIVLTLHAPSFDQIGVGSQTPIAGAFEHRV